MRYRNRRRDILTLRYRYISDTTRKAIIDVAEYTFENLRYKNERGFSFDKFSAKLQKEYDILEDNGQNVHNGDIVDALWEKNQSS